MQNSDERNYHVFFFMVMGGPEDMRKKLKLQTTDHYGVCLFNSNIQESLMNPN